jgi:FAD/FMN-containing dehydrogenase
MAREHNMRVTTRGGGHSYAAYGLGGVGRTGLVVDMQAFQSFDYDETNCTVTAGAGFRLGDLAVALTKHGRALPRKGRGYCPGPILTFS